MTGSLHSKTLDVCVFRSRFHHLRRGDLVVMTISLFADLNWTHGWLANLGTTCFWIPFALCFPARSHSTKCCSMLQLRMYSVWHSWRRTPTCSATEFLSWFGGGRGGAALGASDDKRAQTRRQGARRDRRRAERSTWVRHQQVCPSQPQHPNCCLRQVLRVTICIYDCVQNGLVVQRKVKRHRPSALATRTYAP